MTKSWSGLRKKLENELLCNCLKGRVQYFYTCYHKAPDQMARIAIRVDGKEILRGNSCNLNNHYNELEKQVKHDLEIPKRILENGNIINSNENKLAEDAIESLAIWEGHFEIYHIYEAIILYTNQSIEKSLSSNNPIVKMLSIIDRRIGKRRLLALESDLSNYPEWLKYFYILRIEAEGL